MSINDKIKSITNPTRRGFLGGVFSTLVPLPKGALGAINELSDALPDLSRYALKDVSKHLIHFFSSEIPPNYFFGSEDDIEDCLMERYIYPLPSEDVIDSLTKVYDFSALFDERVAFPQTISSDVPFKIGHLLCKENLPFFLRASIEPFDFDEEDYREFAECDLENNYNALKRIIQTFPNLGSLENAAQIGVQDFFDTVTRPILKGRLKEVILAKISAGETKELGFEIDIFGEKNVAKLKNEFPELSDILDKCHREHLQEDAEYFYNFQPGHFHMEKHGMGAYKLHAPQIL